MENKEIMKHYVDNYWFRPTNPLTRFVMRLCKRPTTKEEMCTFCEEGEA